MTTFPNFYRDAFDATKHRVKNSLQEGEYYFAQDQNEASPQSALPVAALRCHLRDGEVVRGAQILVDKITGDPLSRRARSMSRV